MANEARNTINANEDLFDFFGIDSNGSQDFNFFGDSVTTDAEDTSTNSDIQTQESDDVTPETEVSSEPQNETENATIVTESESESIKDEVVTNTDTTDNNDGDNEVEKPTETDEAATTGEKDEQVEKKTTRRRRRKSADDVKVGKIDSVRSKDNPESTDIFTVPIDPNMSINSIISGLGVMPEPDFMANKEEIERKMREIQIERNLDRANIALMYERIDELSDMLRAHYAFAKSFYDNITNKDIGLIANVKKLNTVGSGTIPEKERNAIMSLMNYKNDTMDAPVNLIQAAWAANYQFNFIQSALDQIETKRRILRGVEDAVLGRS